jgi:hypothetical protein
LFAEDQPAIITPITETLDIASTKKIPTSRFSANHESLIGRTTRIAMYGIIATAGARENTLRSAAAGTTSSFWMNFTPSATSWAHPWNRPASIGPSRACMWASPLCST